ncbi:hypothetical protein Kpho01_53280 [Kitasatospora phosalacinea]|uniref:Uncharacterized protein n=1 Tax=Kitasatospora phosalacinea TaxID=2065 RepID=A0A9W6PLW3_9ACTN|nr:hypothetical protein Kpho01_53280 [Kitasatospora phosalacinea]
MALWRGRAGGGRFGAVGGGGVVGQGEVDGLPAAVGAALPGEGGQFAQTVECWAKCRAL